MKFRNSLMSVAFLMAIVFSLAFKGKSGAVMATYTIPGVVTCSSGWVNEQFCNTINTGPQCTVTTDLGTGNAFDIVTLCVTPLRKKP